MSSDSLLEDKLSYMVLLILLHISESGTKCTQSLGNPPRVTSNASSVDVLSLFRCLVLMSATCENTLSTSALECGNVRSDFTNKQIVGNLTSSISLQNQSIWSLLGLKVIERSVNDNWCHSSSKLTNKVVSSIFGNLSDDCGTLSS